MSHVAPATPTRRARRSHSYSLRPGLTKGIIWALSIEGVAIGLGVLVTWLLLWSA